MDRRTSIWFHQTFIPSKKVVVKKLGFALLTEFSVDSGSCLAWLWPHTFLITTQVKCAEKYAGRSSQKLTVAAVEEFGDDGSTAGGPRAGAIDLDERR